MPRKKGEKFPCEQARAPGRVAFQRYPRKLDRIATNERKKPKLKDYVPRGILKAMNSYNTDPESLVADAMKEGVKEWCRMSQYFGFDEHPDGKIGIKILREPPIGSKV